MTATCACINAGASRLTQRDPLFPQRLLREAVPVLRVLGAPDQPVEHPQDRLLERMRLVDVVDQLRLDVAHRDPPQLEFSVGAAEGGRLAAPAVADLLEAVDEERERRAVAELL